MPEINPEAIGRLGMFCSCGHPVDVHDDECCGLCECKKTRASLGLAPVADVEVKVTPVDITTEPDLINHPPHYTQHPSGVPCIDIIEHMPYNIGAAMKYLWRVGLKEGTDPLMDMGKARWFVERELKRMGGEDGDEAK